MDPSVFDQLAARLGSRHTRRGGLALLFGTATGLAVEEGHAKHKRCKKTGGTCSINKPGKCCSKVCGCVDKADTSCTCRDATCGTLEHCLTDGDCCTGVCASLGGGPTFCFMS